jgi:putative iron-dependent peroxidase
MTATFQPAILRPVPREGTFLTFARVQDTDPMPALDALSSIPHDADVVIGFGEPVAGARVSGYRPFPHDVGLFPATQGAVWAFLAHAERGAQFEAGRALARKLGAAFTLVEEVSAFKYRGGRDLTGFEDGTENPKGDAAQEAAFIAGLGPGLDGGSFVAVQRWIHDLEAMEAMSVAAREAVIGRRLSDNEELGDAPLSAHVKRTAQESFEPPAFILRRSMPYGGVTEHGLYFVAYGESLDRFERQLRRMAGRDDGIVDGLISFSRAETGGYYFCPPVENGRLDLRALVG